MKNRYEDVRAVGLLAEALSFGDKAVRAVAEQALIRLLPRLQPEDAELLNKKQRECLYRAMRNGNPELVIAILKALTRVGDEEALRHVEDLCMNARDPRVRWAAMECLPGLKERVIREGMAQRLLRPADPPCVPPQEEKPEHQ
jgi:HEAT repeat protein